MEIKNKLIQAATRVVHSEAYQMVPERTRRAIGERVESEVNKMNQVEGQMKDPQLFGLLVDVLAQSPKP